MSNLAYKIDILVIGGGQAGLSAAYHLQKLGLTGGRGFLVLDKSPQPGGAWQYRWPSLTMKTVNRLHDLPGMGFAEVLDPGQTEVRAAKAVPAYFKAYEDRFHLPIYRPVTTRLVCNRGERLRVETDHETFSARGIINATGTWDAPQIPYYPGRELFQGRQLHTHDYQTADEFMGKRVVIVGAGISALQILDEVSHLADTIWVTRRPPEFVDPAFGPDLGRAAVAKVEQRVRQGLAPRSVVSVTGIPRSPAIEAMEARGVLNRRPMFSEITATGIRWPDGTEAAADVIIWATGFRSALDHLAPLQLREENGGITMTGRLATQVARDPRVHLVGYGPSASTIGANRAGGAAARELTRHLGIGKT
ncbi:NAD(P)-binding domain-containing protein [Paracoccus fistulariae]|uniref:NAD(P)/FAD-dependent oxidoreductase n=1 Tax=Paracoccus fistulariae TaxID=658446 RepID=A0ABY7SKQ6_9RHOB|nr:NAD(P)-binding domain-containing protein [Paracoccus fistulariae]MDB6180632.1 NAD(P)-binding domain-containing protein [Paracoccus fistulariae]WCR07133.1 NAD(P)/FAD-dependent oxidoreductase [Paracoccus fistulariae]